MHGAGRKMVTALAEELGVRREFLYLWASGCRVVASRQWSEAREGRQGANQNQFPTADTQRG